LLTPIKYCVYLQLSDFLMTYLILGKICTILWYYWLTMSQ